MSGVILEVVTEFSKDVFNSLRILKEFSKYSTCSIWKHGGEGRLKTRSTRTKSSNSKGFSNYWHERFCNGPWSQKEKGFLSWLLSLFEKPEFPQKLVGWMRKVIIITSVMNGCFCDRTNTISSSPYFPGSLLCVFQSLMTSCLWLVENLASGSFFFLLQCLALNRLGVYLLPPELGMRANYLSHQRSPFCAQNTL